LVNHARTASNDRNARIPSNRRFHSSADQRRVSLQQWHRLPLHVRSHQGPVSVVIFQEGNQRCRHRHQLFGRDVNQIDALGLDHQILATASAANQVSFETVVII
jgi:hypothetical protein